MQIYTYEEGGRAEACRSHCLREAAGAELRVALLPIPSLRGGVPCFPLSVAQSGVDAIVGYGLDEQTRGQLAVGGAAVIDCAADEMFLEENAELTAVGMLGVLLEDEQRAPWELAVGIIGYGRIGSRLARMLLSLGARVRIYSSSDDVRVRLGECGVETEPSCPCADLGGLDVLINTAPSAIFRGRKEIDDGRLKVYDLASGTNFDSPRVEKKPSLPAKSFPISAGEAWGRAVLRQLRGEGLL